MAIERSDGDSTALPAARDEVDTRILEAVRSLDYGSVEVVVHDSRVVQIERREKVRLDDPRPRQATPRAPGSRRSRQSEGRTD